MRMLRVALAVAVPFVAAAAAASQSAEAGGLWRERYRSYDAYRYGVDPYAYRYVPRGYYPYYNSGYWRPVGQVRKGQHGPLPPYYKAWGDNKRYYNHREWQARHHGRIHFGYW